MTDKKALKHFLLTTEMLKFKWKIVSIVAIIKIIVYFTFVFKSPHIWLHIGFLSLLPLTLLIVFIIVRVKQFRGDFERKYKETQRLQAEKYNQSIEEAKNEKYVSIGKLVQSFRIEKIECVVSKYLTIRVVINCFSEEAAFLVLDRNIAIDIFVGNTRARGVVEPKDKTHIGVIITLANSMLTEKQFNLSIAGDKENSRDVDNPYYLTSNMLQSLSWQNNGHRGQKIIFIDFQKKESGHTSEIIPGLIEDCPYRFDILVHGKLHSTCDARMIEKSKMAIFLTEDVIKNTNDVVIRANWNKGVQAKLPLPKKLFEENDRFFFIKEPVEA